MTPWTVPTKLLCPWNSPDKNTGEGSQFPSPGDLPDPGIEPESPALQADSLPADPPGKPRGILKLDSIAPIRKWHQRDSKKERVGYLEMKDRNKFGLDFSGA